MPKKNKKKKQQSLVPSSTNGKQESLKIPDGLTVMVLCSRNKGVPLLTATKDVANQVSLAIYGRRLDECIGKAQGAVNVRQNATNYIIVYLPVTSSSSEKLNAQSIRQYKETAGYIRNMVRHAIERGVQIQIKDV